MVTAMLSCDTVLGQKSETALVDSGATHNFISHILAKEWDLKPLTTTATEAETADGSTTKIYGGVELAFRTTDSRRERSFAQMRFLTLNTSGYAIILGQPWLQHFNPRIDWSTGQWRLPIQSTSDVEISPIEEFE
jgi:hypothetical protein